MVTKEAIVEGERGEVVIAEGELVSIRGSGDEVVLRMRCERCSVMGLCCGCVVCGQWYCGACQQLGEWKRFFFRCSLIIPIIYSF